MFPPTWRRSPPRPAPLSLKSAAMMSLPTPRPFTPRPALSSMKYESTTMVEQCVVSVCSTLSRRFLCYCLSLSSRRKVQYNEFWFFCQVGDFGLSRLKDATLLTTKSGRGTVVKSLWSVKSLKMKLQMKSNSLELWPNKLRLAWNFLELCEKCKIF